MRLFVAIAALATLGGCATVTEIGETGTSFRLSREYKLIGSHQEPTARITVASTSGREKDLLIFAHPTDQTRVLVVQPRGAAIGKMFIPIAPWFADLTPARTWFDSAMDQYIAKSRPGCESTESTEIESLSGYEYRIRCQSETAKQ